MALLLCGLMATSLLSAAVDDVFNVDDLSYIVKSESPNEVVVTGFSGASVATLTIPASVMSGVTYDVVGVKSFAFKSDAMIDSVLLPASVEEMGEEAFSSIGTLTYIDLADVVTIGKKALVACAKLEDLGGPLAKCTSLGAYAFNKSLRNVASLEIPMMEMVSSGALYDSDGNGAALLKINIPNTLTETGTLFLGGLQDLVAVQVNWTTAGLDTIIFGDDADDTKFFRYLDKSSITVYVPVGTESAYQAHALWGLFPDANIVEGVLPAIGETFVGNNIEYIITSEDPNEVKVLGFDGASTSTLTIPATVTYPENSEAYSVVSVGASAFMLDAVIDTVNLPESVVELKTEAFSSITTLKFIDLADVVTIESKAVNDCIGLKDLGGPLAKCTSLGDYAFNKSLRKVTSFVMPVMETIGDGAIYESNGSKTVGFTSVDIPASVNDIGTLLLGRCHNLTEVQVHWTDTIAVNIDTSNFFKDVDLTGITYYVPEGKKTMYEEHTLWGQFTHANIIEDVPTGLKPVHALSLSLYPNPTANGVITIGGEAAQLLNVEIFSLSGAVVFQQSVLSQEPISTDLSSGIYMVRVNNATQKLIIK